MFQFKLTHKRRSDGWLVGILPDPDPGYVNYAYEAPNAGGQTLRMREAEFDKAFMAL